MRRGKADREIRREESEIRQTERQERTPQDQLSILDIKLGSGVGAAKERARLQKIIETQANKKQESSAKSKPKTRASRRAEKNKRKVRQNN